MTLNNAYDSYRQAGWSLMRYKKILPHKYPVAHYELQKNYYSQKSCRKTMLKNMELNNGILHPMYCKILQCMGCNLKKTRVPSLIVQYLFTPWFNRWIGGRNVFLAHHGWLFLDLLPKRKFAVKHSSKLKRLVWMASMVVKKTLEVEEAAKEHPFCLNTLSCPSFIDRPYSKQTKNEKNPGLVFWSLDLGLMLLTGR